MRMDKRKSVYLMLLAACVLFVIVTAAVFVHRNAVRTDKLRIVTEREPLSIQTLEDQESDIEDSEYAITERVNINIAGAAELQNVPGIGEVIAARIIDYREQNGNFSSVYELVNVEGIGEKKLEEMLNYICV